jgi:hypothetical protein
MHVNSILAASGLQPIAAAVRSASSEQLDCVVAILDRKGRRVAREAGVRWGRVSEGGEEAFDVVFLAD